MPGCRRVYQSRGGFPGPGGGWPVGPGSGGGCGTPPRSGRASGRSWGHCHSGVAVSEARAQEVHRALFLGVSGVVGAGVSVGSGCGLAGAAARPQPWRGSDAEKWLVRAGIARSVRSHSRCFCARRTTGTGRRLRLRLPIGITERHADGSGPPPAAESVLRDAPRRALTLLHPGSDLGDRVPVCATVAGRSPDQGHLPHYESHARSVGVNSRPRCPSARATRARASE